MNDRTNNLTDKNIREFVAGDTLYIQKTERGYSVNYFVQFVSFERGIVKAKVLTIEPNYNDPRTPEQELFITARLNKCYLWGKDEIDTWRSRCHWFKKDGVVK